ncbi:MAG: hypothetical protein ACK53V_07580, partial [Planctomycetota bacterium]
RQGMLAGFLTDARWVVKRCSLRGRRNLLKWDAVVSEMETTAFFWVGQADRVIRSGAVRGGEVVYA